MVYNTDDLLTNDIEKEKLEKNKVLSSFFFSGLFVLILWLVQFFQWAADKDISTYGVLPRKINGLFGILTAPLIHADFSHLISNSITLFLLLFGILYFYRTSVIKVFFIIYIADGFLVWLFARQAYHIGASGLVYGFAGFLFFSGLFRKDRRSMALSLLIVFLYGGMVWGVLPTDPKISFESHLFGALIGIVCAFIFRKNDPPHKYEWEEEDYEEEIEEDGPDEDIKIDDDAEPEDFRR
ncbi:MAG: rhomboid family intramembrane serine protease [bacterium]